LNFVDHYVLEHDLRYTFSRMHRLDPRGDGGMVIGYCYNSVREKDWRCRNLARRRREPNRAILPE
jgi:hypothetical protein